MRIQTERESRKVATARYNTSAQSIHALEADADNVCGPNL